jgi:hypothetical protein
VTRCSPRSKPRGPKPTRPASHHQEHDMTEPIVRSRTRPQRPLDLEIAEGTVLVHSVAYGTENESRETIRVPVFGTTPAKVRVCGSITRNLGDYNSARVEVMVELPCYPVESEIRRAYDYATGLVDELIPAELEKATGGNAS